tara:strand:+ start:128 stop:529 length:402 start_codon:yes stop_codon:yes gene_type:complete
MANAIYPKYKEAILSSSADSSLVAGTVKVALVDTGAYTYSATHEFFSSVSGVQGTSPTLAAKTVVDGAFDSDNPVWSAISGDTIEAIIIYIDTGVAGTSRLVAYLDTGQGGLPATPSGGDIEIAVAAGGWFVL